MPVHGEYYMLKSHAKIAHSLGIPKENIFICSNGDSLILQNHKVREGEKIPTDDIFIDGNDINGISTAIIKDRRILKDDGVVEVFVAIDSKTNKLLLPPVVKSMNDVMREIFMKDGMPPEIADMMLGEMPPEQQMYVISNNKGINGAVSMLYEDGLHELAEKLGSDLYIMPSSIHEVIAVSTDLGNPNELAAMVAEINMDQVALDERLSNQVYHYDKDLRKVTLATDTPNKRLDGIVAEAPMVYEAGKTR